MLPFLLDQPTHLVNWASPLNQGLSLWLVALPGRTGGGTWFDISGNGNHGALTNMDPAADWRPASTFPGLGALRFTSGTAGDEITITSFPFPSSGGITIELLTSDTAFGSTFGWLCQFSDGTSNNRIGFSVGSSTSRCFFYGFAGGSNTITLEPTTAITGRDHHVFVMDNLNSGTAYIYRNGALLTSDATTSNYTSLFNRVHLGCGVNNSGGINSGGATIPSIAVWFRAMSAGEVQQLHAERLTGNPTTLNRIRRPLAFDTGGGGGGGGLSIPIALYHYQHHFAA